MGKRLDIGQRIVMTQSYLAGTTRLRPDDAGAVQAVPDPYSAEVRFDGYLGVHTVPVALLDEEPVDLDHLPEGDTDPVGRRA